MRARVKQSCKDDSIRSAGIVFSKYGFSDVPSWAEAEIGANQLLEIEGQEEMEPDDSPQTAEDAATRLVIANPGKGRKARKL